MLDRYFGMPERIGDGRLDLLIEIFDVIQSKKAENIVFSFQKTKIIEAAGYAILCCLADALREHAQNSKVISLPKGVDAQFVRKILTYEKTEKGFMKIEKMRLETSSFLVRGVAQGIDPSFPDHVDAKFRTCLGEQKLWHIRFILNELMQNALDHSTAERYFLYAGVNEKTVQFGTCDMGVTIPAKLEQKYNCSNDIAYIKKSLEFGVGTRRVRTGGFGLNHLFKILKSEKGKLVILSRNAQLRIYFKRRKTMGDLLKKPLRGTWCMAQISAGR